MAPTLALKMLILTYSLTYNIYYHYDQRWKKKYTTYGCGCHKKTHKSHTWSKSFLFFIIYYMLTHFIPPVILKINYFFLLKPHSKILIILAISEPILFLCMLFIFFVFYFK